MSKKFPNILFFGIDSLRRDRMSLYGYPKLTTPHIDAFLAEDSIVFDNMFSPSIPTTPGYASMLEQMDDDTLFKYIKQMIAEQIKEQYAIQMKNMYAYSSDEALAKEFGI